MEITYSNMKNIDQNSTAGNIIFGKELVTKIIQPSQDVSSQTASLILPKRKKKEKKPSIPSPIPVSR